MKIEKSAVMLAPKSCESEKNWLSYNFFENTYSGDGNGDNTKSYTRTPCFEEFIT